MSIEKRQCAFELFDKTHLPCWGDVFATQVLVTESGEFILSTCTGHRHMLSNGPYVVDPTKEFDDEGPGYTKK